MSTQAARPKYMAKVMALVRQNPSLTKPGTFTQIQVVHDDWCDIFSGRECSCDPSARVIDLRNQHNTT